MKTLGTRFFCKMEASPRAKLQGMTQVLAEELVDMGASEADLIWAVSLAHSRSFAVPGPGGSTTHIIAPGIDMANHSPEPTAWVR